MKTGNQAKKLIANALRLARDIAGDKVFLFLNSKRSYTAFCDTESAKDDAIVFILPKGQEIPEGIDAHGTVIQTWSGNQTRFSRVKYAFMQAVFEGIIAPDDKVVCVLGAWGKDHLDTITVHDLSLSWSKEFPFDPRSLIKKSFFQTVIAVIDIALDIGTLGREGKAVGTTFVIGDIARILQSSHQAIFNPFKGYPAHARAITSSEVVESMKELAQLDGAFVISETGVVEAAGRHLDAVTSVTRQLKGFGSRHRAAASMTMQTGAIAVVVSETNGRVTVFEEGRIIATLEPVTGSRLV